MTDYTKAATVGLGIYLKSSDVSRCFATPYETADIDTFDDVMHITKPLYAYY